MEKLPARVQVLETKMEFFENATMREIKEDLRSLKQNQFKMFDRFSDIEGRISSLQAHTDERISALQAHTDERITEVHYGFSAIYKEFSSVHREFATVHREFATVHKEIGGLHAAIAVQTRWILFAIIGAATLISIVHPAVLRFL